VHERPPDRLTIPKNFNKATPILAHLESPSDTESHTPAGLSLSRPAGGTVLATLSGDWRLGHRLPAVDELAHALGAGPSVRRLAFEGSGISAWDSGLISFLLKAWNLCGERGIEADPAGLPEGARKLLRLATAVPAEREACAPTKRRPFLVWMGETAVRAAASALEMLAFLGETTEAFINLLHRRARYLRSDLWVFIQEAGAEALPIVSLISFLVGMVLAFVGAVQLEKFGAQIYVANLVGIAMAREMGALMAAIIMAGRTGAAYAAQLGTMQVNEEIDALRTLGISPVEFLVLPRMLALTLMMPLLTLYADLVGILGGAFVALTMLDVNIVAYYYQTTGSVDLKHFGVGLIKGVVFGALVAMSGCWRGMQSGRSSAAVGLSTTAAVVTAIVSIVVADAIFTVIFNVLGI
jgi:phospholipid/cholesterol/gamma-HCH transport system permease protein